MFLAALLQGWSQVTGSQHVLALKPQMLVKWSPFLKNKYRAGHDPSFLSCMQDAQPDIPPHLLPQAQQQRRQPPLPRDRHQQQPQRQNSGPQQLAGASAAR